MTPTPTKVLPHYRHETDSPDSLFERAALGYAAIYDQLTADVDRILEREPEYTWLYRIQQVIDEYRPLIGSVLAETIVASYLAGGHHVAKLVPAHADPAAFLPPVPPLPPIRHPAFGFMPPEPLIHFPIIEEAARDLYKRRLMLKGQYEQLAAEARRNAFTVADVTAMDTLGKIRDALFETVQQGPSLRAFRKSARARLGETWETLPISPARMENVYRTNTQTSWSRGMDAVLDHPFVIDLFPYEEFVEIHDGRLCELCRTIAKSGLNGTGIYRRDDPVWKHFTPPCHWMCRCARIPLQLKQAAAKGIREAQEWLASGRAPWEKALVPWPMLNGMPLALPKGWAA